MGVKIDGMMEVEEMILNVETTARRRVVKTIYAAGVDLQKLAIKMAPIDHGGLEQAIKLRPDSAERLRNEFTGQFERTVVEVYIDMTASANNPERPEVTVEQYAYEVHEHLEPMGSKHLGIQSLLKQQHNGGVKVGGGFMTRAAEAIEAGLDARLRQQLDNPY